MNSRLFNIVLIIALIVLAMLYTRSCNKNNTFEQIVKQANDSLQITINKNGQQLASIASLTGSINDFKKLSSAKDSSLKHLQKIVDKHTLSATVLNVSTNGSATSTTVTIIKYDTVKTGDVIKVYPTYTDSINNRWEQFNITANKDSIHLDYVVFNEFDIVTRNNKKKWWKSRVTEISVLNKNPHTQTKDLKNFTVQSPKNQKINILLGGVVVGVSITSFTYLFINRLL